MNREELTSWPSDLHLVFAALGRAMGERRLSPAILDKVPMGFGCLIADHHVHVTHKSKDELAQRRGRYFIEINGNRWDRGKWSLETGVLEKLSRLAAQRVDATALTAPDSRAI